MQTSEMEESRKRARRLEAILEGVVDSIFVYNEQGTIVQMNTAALRLLDIRNKDQYAALSPEKRTSLLHIRDEHGNPLPEEQWGLSRLLKGETLNGENKIHIIMDTLDGREIHASITGAPLYDEQGNINGAVAVTRDITDNWKMKQQIKALAAEAQTRTSHQEAIVESMTGPVVVYNASGVPIQMNTAAQHLLGIKDVEDFLATQQVQRNAPFGVHDEEKQPPSLEDYPVYHALRGETSRDRELTIIRPDGKKSVCLFSFAPIFMEDGRINGAVVVGQDITERKNLEQQKSEFFSIASHELRTPITSIMGLAEILYAMAEKEDLAFPPRYKHALKEIIRQSVHLNNLIQQMLDLARMENDRMALNFAPHDLLKTMAHVKESWSLVNKHHDIRLILDGPEMDRPLIRVFDSGRIEQVLHNLLDNAAKYSPEGSKIEMGIRCREELPDQVLIWVKDEGIGIPPDELPHIFERFHRASNFDASISGFGIGLYLACEFVALHAGRVWAESIEGQGSIFYVWLPLNSHELQQQ